MIFKEAYEKARKYKSLMCITIFLVLALILFLYYLIFLYPVNQVSQYGINNVTEKVNLINQYRTTSIQLIATSAQIFGGIAVGIGIYFAWGNLKVAQATLESNQINAHKSLEVALASLKSDQETAQKNIEISLATLDSNIKNAQKSLEAAQESQITERFTKAVDQLGATDKDGNPAIEIRLGGIYALERISKESEKDYWSIMEILTAYVRKNSSVEIVGRNKKVMPISTGIQANDDTKSEVSEVGEIPLDIQAILTVIGERKYSCYTGEIKRLDLHETRLCKADFSKTHFEKVNFREANLQDADFRWANLEGANLEGADLCRANLFKAYLHKANLKWAKLDNTTLVTAVLTDANLQEANLKGAFLIMVNFEGADFGLEENNRFLENISWSEAANLEDAHLEDANFRKANLKRANLKGAFLLNTNFERADLRGAKNLTIDQLSQVKTLYNTKLDKELLIPLKEKYPSLFDKPEDES